MQERILWDHLKALEHVAPDTEGIKLILLLRLEGKNIQVSCKIDFNFFESVILKIFSLLVGRGWEFMTLGNFFFESSAAQKEMKLLESHLCSQRRESHIEKEKNIKNITVMLIKYDVIQRQSG